MTKADVLIPGQRSERDQPEGFWRESVETLSRWDVALILSVAVIAIGWLLLNLKAIEYGDPVTHWERINGLLAGDALNVRFHHDARFSIYLPSLVVRILLGDHPNLYYVVPLAAFGALAATTYRLGARVFDRRVGLAAAMLLALFPQSLRSGTQLLPGGFEATFVVLSAYFVLSSRGSDRVFGRPFLAAIFLFLGYLAKVQVLLYAPGLLLALWLVSKSRRAVGTFTLTLAGMGVLEAIAYLVAPWDSPTRLDTLGGALRKWLPELATPLDLFDRYTSLPGYWMWGLASAVLGALLTWRLLKTSGRAFLMIPGSFLIVMTFGLSSLSPLRPLVHFETRFLTSVIPFILLFLAYLVWLAGDTVRTALRGQSRALAIVVMLVVLFVPTFWFVQDMDPVEAGSRNTEGHHPLDLNADTYSAVSDALRTGRTIAISFELEEGSADEIVGNAKRLRYVAVFYLPIESGYRAACFVDQANQILLIAPPSTFDDSATSVSTRVAEAGDVVLIESDPDDAWWLYDVSQPSLRDVEGAELLESVGEGIHTISVREAGDQHMIGTLCPGTG